MSILNNTSRIGCFTSSEIVALMSKGKQTLGFGASAITYIEEKNFERKLGRSLDSETNSKATLWGSVVEGHVHTLLPLEYILCSQQTTIHPEIPYWCGSTDGIKNDEGKTITDIKCPFTMKSFCKLVEPLYNGLSGIDAINWVRNNHKDGEKYYWQLVSNACIHNAKYAELIIYCPYRSELDAIKNLCEGDQSYYFLSFAEDNELPFLLDNGHYRNLNTIRFEVPKADKAFLRENVIKGGPLLHISNTIIATGDTINGQDIIIVEEAK